MGKALFILTLLLSLFIASPYAQDTSRNPGLSGAIMRNIPLERIWANALLKLNLSDKKVIRLRPIFKTFWEHRQQIIDSAQTGNRAQIRRRATALKTKLREELSKHLELGQVIAIMPEDATSQHPIPQRPMR